MILLFSLYLASISRFKGHISPLHQPKQHIILNEACSRDGGTYTATMEFIVMCTGNIIVKNCEFRDCSPTGIRISQLRAEFGETYKEIFIDNNRFINIKHDGLLLKYGTLDMEIRKIESDFVRNCVFQDCGGTLHLISTNPILTEFPMSYININDIKKDVGVADTDDPLADKKQVRYDIKQYSQQFTSSYWNFSNTDVISSLFRIESKVDLRFINVFNVTTRFLIDSFVPYSLDCINFININFENITEFATIFYSEVDVTIKNAIISRVDPVNSQTYLCYNNVGSFDFINSISSIMNTKNAVSGSLRHIFDYNLFIFNSFGCSFSIKPSTDLFSPSHTFSHSNEFSKSNTFSKSDKFSKSNIFSQSNEFSKSNTFSQSDIFSKSNTFSQSNEFLKSNTFSKSNDFTRTKNFASNTFTPSNKFTPSDSRYVHLVKLSAIAAIPTKTPLYGPLSPAAMASVSATTMVGIVIGVGILMSCYIEPKRKEFVEPEIPDFLQLPSDSSDTTENLEISLSYSLHSISRENDPFEIRPEYYIHFEKK